MRPQGHVTVEEAALLVHRTKWAIYKWIRRGHIASTRTDTGTIVLDGRAVLDLDAKLYAGASTRSASS